jgi:hypothetical protein
MVPGVERKVMVRRPVEGMILIIAVSLAGEQGGGGHSSVRSRLAGRFETPAEPAPAPDRHCYCNMPIQDG